VDRIGHPVVGETEVFPGLRVEHAALTQRDHLAQFGLHLLDDLPVVDDFVFEHGRRRDKAEEVVALLGGHLGPCPGRHLVDEDVVDDHLNVVLLAPPLRVLVVEPPVVGGDEMAHLGDPQRPLALAGVAFGLGRPARLRFVRSRTTRCAGCRRSRCGGAGRQAQEIPSGEGVARHHVGPPRWRLGSGATVMTS
jgi:hypothetical protein